MAGKTKEQKKAEADAAEKARRDALTDEEREAEDNELADKEAAEAEAKAKKSNKTSVSVQHAGGVREFTKEIHGDDFADVAQEFADTNKGTIL